MEYTLIRNKRRKKLLLTVKVTGEVVVKSGWYTSDKTIDEFVSKNIGWIEEQRRYYKQAYHTVKIIDREQTASIKSELKEEMLQIVSRYSQIMEVQPSSVKITSAEKRWGSCSGKKSICFSARCAFLSQRCKEYIVVHELSHLKHMNHSKEFYKEIAKYMPDYREAEKELEGYYIHFE